MEVLDCRHSKSGTSIPTNQPDTTLRLVTAVQCWALEQSESRVVKKITKFNIEGKRGGGGGGDSSLQQHKMMGAWPLFALNCHSL